MVLKLRSHHVDCFLGVISKVRIRQQGAYLGYLRQLLEAEKRL